MKHTVPNAHRTPFSRSRRPGGIVKILLSFLLLLLLGSAAFFSVGVTVLLKDLSETLPSSEEILRRQPSLATTVLDRNGRVITTLFEENRTWVPLGKISPWFLKATLAAEDSEFYEHAGLRPAAILRALWIDLSHQRARQGGSTITQQLARNLFLSREKTFTRKIKEAILSIRLERIYSKDKILEMYVNTIYLGHGTYGIGAAAQSYFGKEASALSLAEASTLAGLIAAPEYYTPVRNPEGSKTRQRYVLHRMADLGWISLDQEKGTLAKPLQLRSGKRRKLELQQAPYFVSHLLFKNLLPAYGADTVYRGGLSILTTLDLDLQKAAEKAFVGLPHEGALVALDPDTGEILALVGGRDFRKSKFNRAVQAFRQPGSSFKPLVYAAAFENGYRPVDHLLDAPLTFPNGWSPQNYDRKFSGEVTLVEALGRSLNTPAVRLAQIVGIPSIQEVARKMGITTPHLPDDLSLALGSTSVTPQEMAVAFSCFANNGYRVTPFGIREIRSASGEILEKNGPRLDRGISMETALAVRSMLVQAVLWGTGRAAQVPGVETFGKTGTTNDWSDAWFVGGVPGLVAVVYVGNDNHTSLGAKAVGGKVAAPVWKRFVTEAVRLRGTPARFTVPAEGHVEIVRVCRKTGFLATGSCQGAEVALRTGEAPTAECPFHGGSRVAAREDGNAPQLLLAPADDASVQGRYALRYGSQERSVQPAESETGVETPETPVATEAPAEPVVAAKRPPAKAATPANPQAKPYAKDLSPANEVEKKYQDLLKQYRITN